MNSRSDYAEIPYDTIDALAISLKPLLLGSARRGSSRFAFGKAPWVGALAISSNSLPLGKKLVRVLS
jgi:hypothetical protein